jgi:F0F1-type ATP synthase beta subunit
MNQFQNTEKNSTAVPTKNGYVLAITGTIVDVQFPSESTPDILNELQILFPTKHSELQKKASIEVAQQLGDGVVRCIAIENIYNITRGLEVIDTGAPIKVPVGDNATLLMASQKLKQSIDGKFSDQRHCLLNLKSKMKFKRLELKLSI